jgi:Zn-dependent protease
MLLRYFDLLRDNPEAWLWLMFAGSLGIVSAVAVHEAAHAWSALQLGDTTAKGQGRVTLDPRKHLDPAGSLLFLVAGFGWGKPTPVNPANFRGDMRTGMGLVSIAGPVSNLLTALVLALPIRAGLVTWQWPFSVAGVPRSPTEAIGDLLSYAILFNISLAVFNLVPLVPLDGFKVTAAILPRSIGTTFERLERFGPMPLFLLLLIDVLTPLSILYDVLAPISNAVGRVIVGHPIL